MSVQDPRKDAWKIWFQRHWVLLMCSPLAVLPHQHVAAQRLMEIQTDGQRNLLEWNAAGILRLSCHRSRNCFSLGLTANDKSCTKSDHVSNRTINSAHTFTSLLCNVKRKCNKFWLSSLLFTVLREGKPNCYCHSFFFSSFISRFSVFEWNGDSHSSGERREW